MKLIAATAITAACPGVKTTLGRRLTLLTHESPNQRGAVEERARKAKRRTINHIAAIAQPGQVAALTARTRHTADQDAPRHELVAVAALLRGPHHPLAASAQHEVANAMSGIYPFAHAANASRCHRRAGR